MIKKSFALIIAFVLIITTLATSAIATTSETVEEKSFPIIDSIQDENNMKKIKILAANKTSNITEIKIAKGTNLGSNYFSENGTSIEIVPGKTVEVEYEIQEFGDYTIYAKCENNYSSTREKSIEDCSNEQIRLDVVRDIKDFNRLNVRAISKDGNIVSLKFAQGQYGCEYFSTAGKDLETNGTNRIETYFRVEISDTYTVYAKTDTYEKAVSKPVSNIEDLMEPRISGVSEGETYKEATPIVEDANLLEIKLTKDGNEVTDYTNGAKIVESGNYKLVAVDSEGNTSEVNFTIVNDSISSEIYDIKETEMYIGKISAGTKLADFKQNIKANNSIVVYKDQKEISDTDALATGMILVCGNSMYAIIVNGDIDGNADVTINDLALVRKSILGTGELTAMQKLATDLDYNQKITINDLALIRKMILNK